MSGLRVLFTLLPCRGAAAAAMWAAWGKGGGGDGEDGEDGKSSELELEYTTPKNKNISENHLTKKMTFPFKKW